MIDEKDVAAYQLKYALEEQGEVCNMIYIYK
jgi:hypothetical protein